MPHPLIPASILIGCSHPEHHGKRQWLSVAAPGTGKQALHWSHTCPQGQSVGPTGCTYHSRSYLGTRAQSHLSHGLVFASRTRTGLLPMGSQNGGQWHAVTSSGSERWPRARCSGRCVCTRCVVGMSFCVQGVAFRKSRKAVSELGTIFPHGQPGTPGSLRIVL